MTFSVEPPKALQKWFYAAVNGVDPEATEMPYFFGPLFNMAEEVVFVRDWDGEIAGFATISKNFFKYKRPCLLGAYTLPAKRGSGYGKAVVLEALERLFQQVPDQKVVLEIETPEGAALTKSLPADALAKIDLYDPKGQPYTL